MKKIETLIENALAQNTSLVIAIDGCAGSGKSTYTQQLAARYPIDLIAMDDFFLPMEFKTPERLATPGGNFFLERFVQEVIPHMSSREPWTYRAYDCQQKDYYTKMLLGSNVKIVEGVYSCHPKLRHYYSHTIAFSIDEKLQKERIIKRNGPGMWEKFKNEWIPLESVYYKHFQIFDLCDTHIHINQLNASSQPLMLTN